ncbi:MAG: hypothetical protein QM788_09395 [Roseateles sp.]|uniref:hypothetical protein n=1 Tax=Roseateles sp. TaxID=1971397 RepID=UPI0039EA91AD
MIRLPRTRDARQLTGFTGAPLQARLGRLLAYYYADGATGQVDFKPKARQVWGKAKPQLKKESFGKCAYCEADTAVVAHGDVEHFRPKSAYWWLAYCYDNYTFSCQVCNQTYKGDTFHVVGASLPAPPVPPSPPATPAQLAALAGSLCPDPAAATDASVARLFAAEDADLVDPYTGDPEKLFGWKVIPATQEVLLVPRTRAARARRAVKAAEDMLGLNREELRRLRWQAYDELETMALAIQEGRFTDARKKELLLRLQRQAQGSRPFAGMKRFFLRAWGLLGT